MTNGSKETINLKKNFFFGIEAKPYLSRLALSRGIHFLAENLYTGLLCAGAQPVPHTAPGPR